jgi:hypothetical protein
LDYLGLAGKIIISIVLLRVLWLSSRPLWGYIKVEQYKENPRIVATLQEAIAVQGNTAWIVELISKLNEISQYEMALELYYQALSTFDGGTSRGIMHLHGALAHIGSGAIDKGVELANKTKNYFPHPAHEMHKRANQLIEIVAVKKAAELNK